MPDINIGEFSEALNNKMDLDGNNSNPPIAHMSDITGGIDISQLEQDILDLQNEVKKMLGRPNYSAAVSISLTGNAISYTSSYTCPSDGYVYIVPAGEEYTATSTITHYFNINGVEIDGFSSYYKDTYANMFPVSAGDVLTGKIQDSAAFNTYSAKTGLFFPQVTL